MYPDSQNPRDLQSVPPPSRDARQVAVFRPRPRAELHLSRRYHVHPAIADTVATLAGLGSAVVR